MTTRQPWLRGGSGVTVPYGDALRRTDVATNAGPWSRTNQPPPRNSGDSPGSESPATALGTGTATHASRCPGCVDLARVREQVEAARADAIERGRSEGLAVTAAVRARLADAIAAIDRMRAAREDALTEQVVDLALGLCAELAPAAAAIDRRGLVQLVARSLADAGGARELMLQVCAEDAAVMGTQLPAGMVCTVRAELVPGEVWVEAPRLVVDGRWATRLAALREPLIALVRAAEPAFELATPPTPGGDDVA